MLAIRFRVIFIGIVYLNFLISTWEYSRNFLFNYDKESGDSPYTFTAVMNGTTACLSLSDSENMVKFKALWMKNLFAKTPRSSFIYKKYIQNNTLHFNIPPSCYKFPIDQHTSDG